MSAPKRSKTNSGVQPFPASTFTFQQIKMVTKGKFANFKRDNGAPVIVQFDNEPGMIPNGWGVDTDQGGKTKVIFQIPDETEYQSMIAFQNEIIAEAQKNKKQWWPNATLTDAQVEDNCFHIVTGQNDKKDGDGKWPGSMKATVPMDENSNIKDCVIVDENMNPISVHELPGRTYDYIMVQISGLYLSSPKNPVKWGFMKTIRLIQTATSQSFKASEIDYVDILKKKHTQPRPDNVDVGSSMETTTWTEPVFSTVNLETTSSPTTVELETTSSPTAVELETTTSASSPGVDRKRRKRKDSGNLLLSI